MALKSVTPKSEYLFFPYVDHYDNFTLNRFQRCPLCADKFFIHLLSPFEPYSLLWTNCDSNHLKLSMVTVTQRHAVANTLPIELVNYLVKRLKYKWL